MMNSMSYFYNSTYFSSNEIAMKNIIIIVSSVLIWMALWICLVNSIFNLLHLKDRIELTTDTVQYINKKLNDWFYIDNK